MKSIPQNSSSAQWDNQLVQDLAFIKKHKRYPLRRMTIMPLLGSTIIIGFFLRLFWVYVLAGAKHSSVFLFAVIFGLLAIPTFISFNRYLDLIRFRAIKTSFFLAENMNLLELFLKEQRLLVFRHPEAPEVFQIISKNIDALGDEREALIFVADDKRILVNSHFTSSRKSTKFLAAPTHHKQMIRTLREWLDTRLQENTSLPIKF